MTDMTRARAFPERHFPAQGRAISASGIVPPLDKLIALPFDAGGTFDALCAWTKYGGSADSVVRLGLYGSNIDGLPGALIYDAGEYETNTAHQGGVALTLDEPRFLDQPYWVVALFGGTDPEVETTAPTMVASAGIPSIEMQHLFGLNGGAINSAIFSAASQNAVLADFEYASLPEEFPAGTLGGTALWLTVRTPAAA